MKKRTISMGVACLLTITLLCQLTASAGPSPDQDARAAQKVKAALLKLGTGPDTRVDLKLKDKTRLAGYVSEIGDSSFVVVDAKSAEARTVAYPNVVQVKGNNLTTGAKIAIWVAVAAAVAIILYSVKGAFCDGC
jgi:hypothetical protein